MIPSLANWLPPPLTAQERDERREAYSAYLETLARWGCDGPVVAALRRALERLETEGSDHV